MPDHVVPLAVLALSLLLGPVILGAAAGIALRRALRARRPRLFAALAIALVPPAAAWFGCGRFPEYSPYDLLLIAGLAGATAAVTLWPFRAAPARRDLALLGVTLALGLGVLEIWARSHPMPIAPPPPIEHLRARFAPEERAFQCPSLFPSPGDPARGRFGQRENPSIPPRTPGRRRVAHLGDSMVAGGDVPRPARFVERLSALRGPAEEHLNLGIANTGTDAHLQVARAWLGPLGADAVVLHVFPGNDLAEIDMPYACCDDGPLLDWTASPPAVRCNAAIWRFSRGALLSQGPPPFPLRVLATRSALAHQWTSWLERTQRAIAPRRGLPDGSLPNQSAARFQTALAGIAAEARRLGIPLSVVVLPSRVAIESSESPIAASDRRTRDLVIHAAAAEGLPTLDAWAYFEDLARTPRPRPLFQPRPNDPHFEVEGHRLYSEWLAARLARTAPAASD